MTTQIAVRLPDELLTFVDATVAAGSFSNRADVVRASIEEFRRRRLAEADIEILRWDRSPDELDDIASAAASTPLDL